VKLELFLKSSSCDSSRSGGIRGLRYIYHRRVCPEMLRVFLPFEPTDISTKMSQHYSWLSDYRYCYSAAYTTSKGVSVVRRGCDNIPNEKYCPNVRETVVNLISHRALEPAVSPIFATVPQVSWPRNLLFVWWSLWDIS
jgi:hypothetical protein